MEKDWVKIWSTNQIHKAQIAEALLQDNEIEVIVINKIDSSYPTFGSIELFVHIDNTIRAIQIINKNQL